MEDKLAQSIERRLKWLFWLFVPGAFVYLLVAAVLLTMIYNEHFAPKPAKDGDIVVARVDLAVGDELSRTNLALRTMAKEQWPEDLVSPGHARYLLGHKMVRSVSKGLPVTWYHTDIPIPTPSVASEQVRHELNPEPEVAR